MPTVVRRETAATVLSDHTARLRKLETFGASGMIQIAQTPGLNYASGSLTTTPVEQTPSRTPTFTLNRTAQVFVVPVVVAVTQGVGSGGGQLQYFWPYIAYTSIPGGLAYDVYGSTSNTQATVMVKQIGAIGNTMDTCHPFSCVLAAGTYQASLFAAQDAGSGSFCTILGQLTVWQLPG